ncbi:hypothetical protein HOF56_04780, partial [Candidatus Peribacteria bacterium]|nr:hypothetical protein [Candidatus Peribacteria bacterium]
MISRKLLLTAIVLFLPQTVEAQVRDPIGYCLTQPINVIDYKRPCGGGGLSFGG